MYIRTGVLYRGCKAAHTATQPPKARSHTQDFENRGDNPAVSDHPGVVDSGKRSDARRLFLGRVPPVANLQTLNVDCAVAVAGCNLGCLAKVAASVAKRERGGDTAAVNTRRLDAGAPSRVREEAADAPAVLVITVN